MEEPQRNDPCHPGRDCVPGAHRCEGDRALCEELEEQKEKLSAEYKDADKDYLKKRDEYNTAVQVIRRFEELEQAEQTLTECEAAESEIREKHRMISEIGSAYEIQPYYDRFMDSEKMLMELKRNLSLQQDVLPGLDKSYRNAVKQADLAAQRLNEENQKYTKLSERVKQALELFEKIRTIEAEVERAADKCAETARVQKSAEKRAAELEEKEREGVAYDPRSKRFTCELWEHRGASWHKPLSRPS